MTWRLEPQPHETFDRNALQAVIWQLRFDPILKMSARVPDFQDRIRHRFPGFEKVTTQSVELSGDHFRVSSDDEFHFRAKGEPSSLILGTQSVALEYRRHQHRAVLFQDVELVLAALQEIHTAISPVRLGLRYVNGIDRDRLQQDVGRPLEWQDLVSQDFLRAPAGLADLDGTAFVADITSPCSSGAMRLRYGIVPEDGRSLFRIDVDRFQETGIAISTVRDSVAVFANDIFSVFRNACGPALLEWMKSDATGTLEQPGVSIDVSGR